MLVASLINLSDLLPPSLRHLSLTDDLHELEEDALGVRCIITADTGLPKRKHFTASKSWTDQVKLGRS